MSRGCHDCDAVLEYSGRGRPPERCLDCRKRRNAAQQARYYAKNKDKLRAQQARYYAERRAADPSVPDCRDCGAPGASKRSKRCGKCYLAWESEVVAMRGMGVTNAEIGSVYGVSGARIWEVVTACAPHLTGSVHDLRRSLDLD